MNLKIQDDSTLSENPKLCPKIQYSKNFKIAFDEQKDFLNA